MTRKRLLAVPVALVVAGGAGWLSYAAASPDTDYRTATATVRDVAQTLELTGTVSPTGRVDLAFGTDGTVAEVRVSVGDRVKASEVIAVLDRRELRAQLKAAQADLAAAKAQLEADQDAQAEAVTAAVSATSSSQATGASDATRRGESAGAGSTGNGSAGAANTGGEEPDGQAAGGDPGSVTLDKALAELRAQQQATTAAQSEASGAIATAEAALATQQEVCQPVGDTAGASEGEAPDGGSTGGGAIDGGASEGGASEGGGSEAAPAETSTAEVEEAPAEEAPAEAGSAGGDAGLTQECQQALAAVQSAQATVAGAQSKLQAAMEDLAGTLDSAVKTLDPAPQQQAGPEEGQQPQAGPQQPAEQPQLEPQPMEPEQAAPGSVPDATEPSASRAGASETVTAATLARDQATIDQATVDVLTAQEALAAAVVRAPASGQVVSLSAAHGDDVAAGSAAAVVVGKGLTVVDVEVSASQAAQLETGQEVSVTPAGAEEPLSGTVTGIRNTPVEDDPSQTGTFRPAASSETKYPVAVTLDRTDLALASGMPASVEITVGRVTDTLTVPTSAVSNGAVTVLEDGETSSVRVTTGVMGDARTEIIEGLEEGTQVVLADLAAELPTGGSQTGPTGGFGGGGGRFGGGRRGGAPPGFGS